MSEDSMMAQPAGDAKMTQMIQDILDGTLGTTTPPPAAAPAPAAAAAVTDFQSLAGMPAAEPPVSIAPTRPQVLVGQPPAPAAAEPAPAIPEGLPGIPADVMARPAAPGAADANDLKDAPPSVQNDARAAATWKTIKQAARAAEAKAVALEAEKKQLSDALELAKVEKVPDITELADMKKQLDDAEAKLSQVSLEHSRAFRSRYDDQILSKKSAMASILTRVGQSDADAKALAEKLASPSTTVDDVQELLGGLPQVVQATLGQSAFDVQSIQQR